MRLLRPLALPLASLFATACGSSLDTSATKTEDPNVALPEFREPAVVPGVESITPTSGSSNTRWTLHGVGLGEVDAVWFGDSAATIESVTDTEIVVTDAFGQRASMGVLAVSFSENGNFRTGPSVFGYPDGSVREAGKESRTWHTTSWTAASPSTIWVVDSTRGLYSVDRAHDTVELEARNGHAGLGILTSVFVSPSGEIFVTDETSDGNRRLLRRDGPAWSPLAVLAEPIVDLAFGDNGALFVVLSQSIRKLLTNGSDVSSFAPQIPDEIGGALMQNDTLYVTQKWTGTILAIEPTWGGVIDLAIIGLSTPGAIAGDGSVFYVTDDNGVRTVDGDGQVQTWSARSLPFGYGSIRRIVLSGSSILVSAPGAVNVMELTSASAARIAAGGIGSAYGAAHIGDSLVLSSYESCFDESGSSELPIGVVYALTAGAARIVSRTVCPVYGLSASGSNAVLYTSASSDLSLAEVGRLSLDGVREVLATEADGLRFPMSAVTDDAGNVYVAEADFFSSPASGLVSRIDASGTFTSGWAYSPNANGYSWALAVSGNDLWMMDMGAMGVWKVALDEGGVTSAVPATEALFPSTDGLAADGNGGIVISDLANGSLFRLDAAGILVETANGFELPSGIVIDRTTGDLQVLDLGVEGVGLHSIMP